MDQELATMGARPAVKPNAWIGELPSTACCDQGGAL